MKTNFEVIKESGPDGMMKYKKQYKCKHCIHSLVCWESTPDPFSLHTDFCENSCLEWLSAPSKVALSKREIELLSRLRSEGFKCVTKDKDGTVQLFTNNPKKQDNCWVKRKGDCRKYLGPLDLGFVKWYEYLPHEYALNIDALLEVAYEN